MSTILKVTGGKWKTEDIFWRKEYAIKIWRLIENIWKDGFVISINSWWGEWKTTFLNDIFIPSLKWEEYETIYFDAFEHDFFNNPLSAITWAFLKWVWIEGKGKMKKNAKNFLKVSWRILLRYAMKWDIPEINNRTESAIEWDITNFAINELSNYLEAEKWIKEFKKQLENFTKNLDKPLIFIVDELDRCKPSFALEIIEIIKHFFSLKNVVFVLSINKEQITSYITHQYWNSSDSENYLHKFIDIETELPEHTENWIALLTYCETLYKDLNLWQTEKINFWVLYTIIWHIDISLRELEKILNYLKLMQYSIKRIDYFNTEIAFLLSYLKVKHYNIYKKSLFYRQKNKYKELHEIFNTSKSIWLYTTIEFLFNINSTTNIKEVFQKDSEWSFFIKTDNLSLDILNHHLSLLKNFS